MKHAFLASLAVIFAAWPAVADTTVPAQTISTNTTWTLAGSPYIVTGRVLVQGGSSPVLTIEAGVTVKFTSNADLVVNWQSPGVLQAIGTPAAPILFTSASGTAPNSWLALYIGGAGGANSQISYATVENGGWTSYNRGGLEIAGTSSLIDHVTFRNNNFAGLNITGGSPQITNCTLTSNSGYGLDVTGGTPTITSATLTNNTDYAIGVNASVQVNGMSGLAASGNGTGKDGILMRADTISANRTWHVAAIPYVVNGTIWVQNGANPVLTIEAGTTVKFAASSSLVINYDGPGVLQAVGTSTAPILFTSQSGTSPSSWVALYIGGAGSTNSQISYATIENGGWPGYNRGGLQIAGTSSAIDHVTFRNNNVAGMNITGGSPQVTNCTFDGNSGYGLDVTGGTPTISNATFTNNTNYAIGVNASLQVNGMSGLAASGNGPGKDAILMRADTISANRTWHLAAIPYVVSGTIWVQNSANPVLTIEAGVTVKFAASSELVINYAGPGVLQAVGTSTAPILFTSLTGSSPSSWIALYIGGAGSTNSQISYATVENGGWPGYNRGGLQIDGTSSVIDHVTFRNNNVAGMNITGGSPRITNCTFDSNSGYGLTVTASVTATINGCVFTNNTNYAISIDPSVNLLDLGNLAASGNGSGTKDAIEQRAGDVLNTVRWPNCTLPRIVAGLNVRGTLTIDPGAVIKVVNGQGFNVYGRLLANGTSAAPISFTSSATNPAPGIWSSIDFIFGSGPSQMSYATISYSGGFYAAIIVDGGSPTFDHVTVANSAGSAVRVTGVATPTFRHCAFTSTPAGISNLGTEQVSAILCYWGAADGPSGTGHGSGLSVSWNVSFDPWLTASPSAPEYVSAVSVQSRTFNPSLSAYPTIAPTFALSASWTITILNSSQTVLRSYSGSGQTASVTWDGNDSNGVPQTAGSYTFKIDSTATTGEIGTTARGVLLLTSAAYQPSTAITAPASGDTLSNVYQNGSAVYSIIGSAADPNMHNWTLDYSPASNPTGWITLTTGTSNVQNAQFTTWNILPLSNASYSLRLRSWDNNGNYSLFTEPVTVANFQFTQPSSYQINAAASGSLTYTSLIPFTLTETFVFKDASGNIVRTLVNGASRPAGTYNDTWNGLNDSGQYLPDAQYFYTVTVTDGVHTMTWDVSGQFAGPGMELHDGLSFSPFDPFNNQPLTFTYTSNVAGLLYIAISPSDVVPETCDAPNWCLVNGKWQEAGTHTVAWSGAGPDGALHTGKKLGCVTINSQFPKNAVLLFGITPTIASVRASPAIFSPNSGTQTLTFSLSTFQSQTANLTVKFINQSSLSVLRTIPLSNQAPGNVSVTWDGRADNGMLVAPGYYTINVNATDALGNQVLGQVLTTVRY